MHGFRTQAPVPLIVPCAENNSIAIFACQTACHCLAHNLARKSAKMAGKMAAKNEAKPAARPLGRCENIRKRGARFARAPFSGVWVLPSGLATGFPPFRASGPLGGVDQRHFTLQRQRGLVRIQDARRLEPERVPHIVDLVSTIYRVAANRTGFRLTRTV